MEELKEHLIELNCPKSVLKEVIDGTSVKRAIKWLEDTKIRKCQIQDRKRLFSNLDGIQEVQTMERESIAFLPPLFQVS